MDRNSQKCGALKQMSDVAMARDYVAMIGGPGTGKSKVWKAYKTLSRMFPNNGPRDQWTHRRVRSFWERDASFVKYREMHELHRAAEEAKAERELLAQARKEHAEFIAKTASIRAFLERQDEAFYSGEIERLGIISGRVDRSGTGGE